MTACVHPETVITEKAKADSHATTRAWKQTLEHCVDTHTFLLERFIDPLHSACLFQEGGGRDEAKAELEMPGGCSHIHQRKFRKKNSIGRFHSKVYNISR